jgi:hypothetical protein
MGKKPTKTRTTYNVTQAEFVTAWQSSETADEAAEKLGMPKDIVVARAAAYRKKKVKLKNMSKPGRKPLDVDGLNQLIKELAEEKNKRTGKRAAGA